MDNEPNTDFINFAYNFGDFTLTVKKPASDYLNSCFDQKAAEKEVAFFNIENLSLLNATETEAKERGWVRAIFLYENPATGEQEPHPWEEKVNSGWKRLRTTPDTPQQVQKVLTEGWPKTDLRKGRRPRRFR